ncbi:hypothetical protein [Pantoea sp.]|nr:hypothetical protein [Pantoea sp.]
MPEHHKGSLLHVEKQGGAVMKLREAIFIAATLLIAMFIFGLVLRKDFCGVEIDTDLMNFAVSMACKTVK